MNRFINRLLITAFVFCFAITSRAQDPDFGAVYGGMQFFGDIKVGSWDPVSNLQCSAAITTNSTIYTNNPPVTNTFYYMIGATNKLGSIPVSMVVTCVLDESFHNSVSITWDAKGGMSSYLLAKSYDGTTFTNYFVIGAASTSYEDTGIETAKVGTITNFSTIGSPTVDFSGAQSVLLPQVLVETQNLNDVLINDNISTQSIILSNSFESVATNGSFIDIQASGIGTVEVRTAVGDRLTMNAETNITDEFSIFQTAVESHKLTYGELQNTNNVISGARAVAVAGLSNSATEIDAVIVGGTYNSISGEGGTVVAGVSNSADNLAFVGSGKHNIAGGLSVVGGGNSNVIFGSSSVIGGGSFNTAGDDNDTVSGGRGSTANGPGAVVSGGITNRALARGSTIAGGEANVATGIFSTITGGSNNLTGGSHAYAAGRGSSSLNDGSMSIGFDINNTNDGAIMVSTMNSTNKDSHHNDEFVVDSQGGMRFYIGTNDIIVDNTHIVIVITNTTTEALIGIDSSGKPYKVQAGASGTVPVSQGPGSGIQFDFPSIGFTNKNIVVTNIASPTGSTANLVLEMPTASVFSAKGGSMILSAQDNDAASSVGGDVVLYAGSGVNNDGNIIFFIGTQECFRINDAGAIITPHQVQAESYTGNGNTMTGIVSDAGDSMVGNYYIDGGLNVSNAITINGNTVLSGGLMTGVGTFQMAGSGDTRILVSGTDKITLSNNLLHSSWTVENDLTVNGTLSGDAGGLTNTYTMFLAGQDGDQSFSVGSSTKMMFTNEVFDAGSTYDAANAEWTPGIVGPCRVDVGVKVSDSDTNDESIVKLFRNGADYRDVAYDEAVADNNDPVLNGSVVFNNHTTTNIYDVRVFRTGSAKNSTGGEDANWWSGQVVK